MDMSKAKPIPTLLNKSDAMLHAADQLERQAGDLELISIVADVFRKNPMTAGDADESKLADLKVMASGIVDKDLQVAALREAAKEIRAHAHETKLAEARASSRGINA